MVHVVKLWMKNADMANNFNKKLFSFHLKQHIDFKKKNPRVHHTFNLIFLLFYTFLFVLSSKTNTCKKKLNQKLKPRPPRKHLNFLASIQKPKETKGTNTSLCVVVCVKPCQRGEKLLLSPVRSWIASYTAIPRYNEASKLLNAF